MSSNLKRQHGEMAKTGGLMEEHMVGKEDGDGAESVELTNDNEDELVPVEHSEVKPSVSLFVRLKADTDKAKEWFDKLNDSCGKLNADQMKAGEFVEQAKEACGAAKKMMIGGQDINKSIEDLGNTIEALKEAIQQLQDDQKALEELPTPTREDSDNLLAQLVASGTNTVARSADFVAAKTEVVAAKAKDVVRAAEAAADKAEKTHNFLYHLATLCNNTEMSRTHTAAGTVSATQNQRVVPTNSPDCISSMESLLTSKETLKPSGEYNKDDQTLFNFSSFLKEFVNSAETITKEKDKITNKKEVDDNKEKIEATVNAISNYIPTAKAPVQPGVKYGIPVPPGQEVDCVQPILTAIIGKVASFVEASGIKKKIDSPSKGVQNERQIEPLKGATQEKWRRVDAIIHKDRKAWPSEIRSFIPLTVEYKPLGREKKSVSDLIAEGRDQQLGHMAKRLMSAFNFAGVGVDGHSTGVVMTLASVEVMQLRFQREEFSVKLSTTGPLPLFPKSCVEKLLDGKAEKDDTSRKFLEELFPETIDQVQVPAGLVMLWKLLNTPSHELFSDYWTGGTYTSDDEYKASQKLELNLCLGRGAFGMVYSLQNKDNLVVKVVQSGQHPSIQNEIQVLKKLWGTCKHIPSFESHGNVSVFVRGVKVQQTAMLTSPRGHYNTHELAVQGNLKWKDLRQVASDVGLALEHALLKGFYHLDVRPSNIVQKIDGERGYYVLVDWGCAKHRNESVKGFVGSFYYAHSEIHKNNTWTPNDQFDKASLLYTLVVLHCSGHILWRHSGMQVVERREKEVDAILKKWNDKKMTFKNLEGLIGATT